MNKTVLEGKWTQLRGRIKEQWGDLTDNEVAQAEGNYEQLVGTLQEKYGYAREKAEEEVTKWADKYDLG